MELKELEAWLPTAKNEQLFSVLDYFVRNGDGGGLKYYEVLAEIRKRMESNEEDIYHKGYVDGYNAKEAEVEEDLG